MGADIPQQVIDDVIARTDIVAIIAPYVKLKKRGNDMVGLCPFHSEDTPSFKVSPKKQFYKCFGCGEAGNAIKFLMEIEGWGFRKAVEHLGMI